MLLYSAYTQQINVYIVVMQVLAQLHLKYFQDLKLIVKDVELLCKWGSFTDLLVLYVPDGTAQYVNGTEGVSAGDGLYQSGLPCVSILIGAFHKTSGHPIMGVINQPFARRTTDQ